MSDIERLCKAEKGFNESLQNKFNGVLSDELSTKGRFIQLKAWAGLVVALSNEIFRWLEPHQRTLEYLQREVDSLQKKIMKLRDSLICPACQQELANQSKSPLAVCEQHREKRKP